MSAVAGCNNNINEGMRSCVKLASVVSGRQCCKQRSNCRVGCTLTSQQSKLAALENLLVHPDAVKRREEAKRRQENLRMQQLEQLTTDWWMMGCGENMMVANSPLEFEDQLSEKQSQGKLTVVKFFAPFCHACKSMNPKIQQIAQQNADVAFIKFNAGSESMRAQAEAFGVNRLPYFHIYLGPVLVAAFTANLVTVTKLRRAIQTFKQQTPKQQEQQCYYNNIVSYPTSVKSEHIS
eukprot:TRINITY_DN969_c2_g1_i2.p1 TRINITY_DN969_c2_g1~~TRINITY_DN969_c2_g1_i2.p1  ORF type:complete len:236 (-),score=32.87 TRINITY_DN969_c2_g1_i2:201-908(-)